jgi:putative hydrolase of the HAD superfamily
MSIKAIVFDMDDTLYYESDYVRSGMKELGKWIMENYNVDGFYETAIGFFETGERKYIFNKTLDILKIPYNEKLIQSMIILYRSHKPYIKLLNDSKWVLERLNKNIKIGLISDGYFDAQTNKVHSLGIEDKFHSIILTDQFGRNHWKPSQKPYEQTILNLKVTHDECMYIGDNVKKDFIAANKLGWKTVHIDRECGVYSNIIVKQEYMAHYKISNLKKLSVIPEFQHLFNKG